MSKSPKTVFVCQECGVAGEQVARPVPRLRRVELLVEERPTKVSGASARSSVRGGERGRAPRVCTRTSRSNNTRGFPRASTSSIASSVAALCPVRWCCSVASPGSESPRCCCKPPRISRGPSARFSTARAKNPNTRSNRAANGWRSGRAPLYLLAETCLERILEEIARIKPALVDRRLDSDRVLAEVSVCARQHRSGARSRDAVAVHGEESERADAVGRPRHERWQPRRTEGARARRRYRPLLRGRTAPFTPRRSRGEESIRRGQRAGCVRDDIHRSATGAEPVEAVPGASVRRMRLAPRCSVRSRAHAPSWSRFRRSSVPAVTETREGWPAGSISSGCHCFSPSSKNAPG